MPCSSHSHVHAKIIEKIQVRGAYACNLATMMCLWERGGEREMERGREGERERERERGTEGGTEGERETQSERRET